MTHRSRRRRPVNTPQGVALPIVLTGTDAEGSALTFSIFSAPTAGTLSGAAPNVTYTPPAGFTGTATFAFRANDGAVFSTPATVTVIVGPPPANSADVTLALVDAPDPVALGGVVTYTATIHNNGPAAATGVAFTLTYPLSDLLVQTVTPSQGTCTSGNPIACAIGGIANGGNVTVTVAMRAFNRGGTFAVSSTVVRHAAGLQHVQQRGGADHGRHRTGDTDSESAGLANARAATRRLRQ